MFGLETGVELNADASTALLVPMATSHLRLIPHFQQQPLSYLSKANSGFKNKAAIVRAASYKGDSTNCSKFLPNLEAENKVLQYSWV